MAQPSIEPAQQATEPQVLTVPLAVSFSYYDARLERCFLTFQSYGRNCICFAPSKVTLATRGQNIIRNLTPSEHAFIVGVRQAPISSNTVTDRIVLAPHYVTLGPYPIHEVGDHAVTILWALNSAYVSGRTIHLTYLDNWPPDPLLKTRDKITKIYN